MEVRGGGAFAWSLFNERVHAFAMGFDGYHSAEQQGVILRAVSVTVLTRLVGAEESALERSLAYTCGDLPCPFERDFTGNPALEAPYYLVRVMGALFHTQGGISIDADARVLRADGSTLPNLYAGGGAACGVSGQHV